jgi:sporulation protein YlmC with PRC-barrel domain
METQLMRLSIGSAIRCRDGMAGRLKYVVIDPDDGKVTNLIVERGRLLRRDIVVPAAWVEEESEGEIVLNATTEDLNTLPEYKEFEFMEPDPTYRPVSGHRVEDTRIWISPYQPVVSGRPWILWRVRLGIQDEEVVLQRGLPVHDRENRAVGTIDHLVVEPGDRRITHLVLRRGWPWEKKMHIVPMGRVSTVTEKGARLNMTVEELNEAPLYQPPATDEQITFALQRALETDPRTREAGLRVEVQEGLVRFFGTMTNTVQDAARSIARRMRGVIGFTEDMVEPEPRAARKQRL